MEKINPEEFNVIPTPFRPLLRVFRPFPPLLMAVSFSSGMYVRVTSLP